MNQWTFVFAAYAVALGGTAGLIGWALASCRRAEDRATRIGRPQ
jgi:hypothetical protein